MTVTDVCDDELLAGHDVASFALFYRRHVDAMRWTRDLRAQSVNSGILDGTTMWVQATDRANRRDRLWRLDARTGHVTGSLGLPEFGAPGLVTVGKHVWTMSIGGDLQVALKKG